MKSFFQHIQIKQVLISAVIGLGLGGLIWGGGHSSDPQSHVGHDHSTDAEEVWTCAMHPQIRQHEPGTCPICGMDLTLANESAGGEAKLEMTPEAVALAQIETFEIGAPSAQGQGTRKLNGVVVIPDDQVFSQTTHIEGEVRRLLVKSTGMRVRKGQKIAELYSTDYLDAQQEVLQAAALAQKMPQLLEAAKAKMKHWRVSDTQIDQLIQSGNVQPMLMVYADYAGVVTRILAEEGAHLMEGQSFYQIAQLNPLWVEFEAYEQDLAGIRTGQEMVFQVAGKSYRRPITYIDPTLNAQSRSARVRVSLSNSNGQLKPEMLAQGSISGASAHAPEETRVIVPRSAVLWTGTQSFVYVQDSESEVPQFELRKVTLGTGLGDHLEITEGLALGERVVVKGTFVVDAAAQLAQKPSMMNRDIAVKGAKEESRGPAIERVESVASDFQQALAENYRLYLALKTALVGSDQEAVSKAAQDWEKAWKEIDDSSLNEEGSTQWQPLKQRLDGQIESLAQLEDLPAQRKRFTHVSNAMIELAATFGFGEMPIYVQFCPMANNDRGGYWLSDEEEVLNPYFGDQMLHCGWVDTTYFPASNP
ncbi:efflux RND transporter periplasmic adaptor subunit [Pontibacter sp. G13]|uniref:efflux RND transporter periplasmic adaptor subunit n=1 Tax=Pontibacter sp. G13 TaxID=3074898 RepID=UPI00288A8E78|nr:efflux RND transporter periplasmic adaptor subunit [Pontibacter sp. G13]WNJ16449.1 efflux RND transporter periplasmic adaptor subunit [Pontibacter sp. G13]